MLESNSKKVIISKMGVTYDGIELPHVSGYSFSYVYGEVPTLTVTLKIPLDEDFTEKQFDTLL